MKLDQINTREELKFRYREVPPEIDVEEFAKVVESRRSIRVFRPDPIPEEVMQRCLDWALLAPNSSNLQTWEFYWVRSPAVRKSLVEACLSQPAAKTAAELVVVVARPERWKENRARMLERFGDRKSVPAAIWDYYAQLVPLAYNQGFANWRGWGKRLYLWVRGWSKPTPREPVSHHQMELWAVKSTALGAENLMLGLRATGYDSCPLEGLDSQRVKKLLGLPRSAIVVMVVAAGKRDPDEVYGPRIRFDRELFVHVVD